MARCTELLAGAALPTHFPVIADLYLNYATVLHIAPREKRWAGAASRRQADWLVHLTRRRWLHLVKRLGLDGKLGARIFKDVNQAHAAKLEAAKVELLHKGSGTLGSEALARQGVAALTSSTFSLAEFLEAMLLLACHSCRVGKWE